MSLPAWQILELYIATQSLNFYFFSEEVNAGAQVRVLQTESPYAQAYLTL